MGLMTKCVKCGGTQFRPGSRERAWKLAGRTIRVEAPAEECAECGEAYTSLADLERSDLAAAVEAARGAISADALQFMRATLGLQGTQMAALLGVSREHYSRWENGRHAIDRAAWVAVGALVADALAGRRDTMSRLEALRDGRVPKRRSVRVKLAPRALAA